MKDELRTLERAKLAMELLLEDEGDDTYIMHQLRCMGFCGGWSTRDTYLKGALHANNDKIKKLAEQYRLMSPLVGGQAEFASLRRLLEGEQS